MLTISEFILSDTDDTSESVCTLKFSRRKNGNLRCRLVFDEELSEMFREKGTMLRAEVSKRGDIMLWSSPTGLTISLDRRAFISLDKYAKKLYDIYGEDTECGRFLVAGGSKVLVAPMAIQHINR